jgi:hypothetical protein
MPLNPSLEELSKDGGMMSRKLHLTLLVIFLTVGLGLACNWLPALGVQLQTVVTGLLGALAIFVGGNIAGKFNASSLMKVMGGLRKLAPEPGSEEVTEDAAKPPEKPANEPPVETG